MSDPIDDLEAMLTKAARRRHAPRRRGRRWRWGAGVAVALGVAVPAAASVDLIVGIGPGAPPDSTPASAPNVDADTRAAGGGELGVATYRNAEGLLCAALGDAAANGRLIDRRGRDLLMGEVGDCTMRPEPVAVKVHSQADDPATPGNERSLVVWGLAADSVEEIEIVVADETRVAIPGPDGAFVATLPPAPGRVALTIRQSDGSEEMLALPPAPDLDELNRQLRAGEIPKHVKGGP